MSEERASYSPPQLAEAHRADATSIAREARNHEYAFLNHNASTVKNGDGPTIDNKPLARQKRRRTSPEDQAILEASYQQNPKPDKAARMALVERVALGEKEVQIWFQNRRQSTRRKSRPLQDHELEQMRMPKGYASPITYYPATDVKPLPQTSNQHQETQAGSSRSAEREAQESSESTEAESSDAADKENMPPPALSHSFTEEEGQDASMSFTEVPSCSQPFPSSQESNSSTTANYLANRRSAAIPRPTQDAISLSQSSYQSAPQADTQGNVPSSTRHGTLKKSSSVRLSFGTDGSATVLTGDMSSPSPPRQSTDNASTSTDQRPAPPAFGRSLSNVSVKAAGANNAAEASGSQTSEHGSGLRRVPSFRSRDSRAWEYFCSRNSALTSTADAPKSELEEKAEQENSGSAADAIKGLVRSSSLRSLSAFGNGGQSASTRRSLGGKRTASASFSGADILMHEKAVRGESSAKRMKTSASFAGSMPAPPPSSAPSRHLDTGVTPARSLQRSNSARNILSSASTNRTFPGPPSSTGRREREKDTDKPFKTPKLGQGSFEQLLHATDSDKENWSPERNLHFLHAMATSPAVPPTTIRRRGPVAHTPLRGGAGTPGRKRGSPVKGASSVARSARRKLDIRAEESESEQEREREQENERRAKAGRAGGGGGGSKERRGSEGRERSRKSDSVSEEEDLDCVQGLLSLSQGAWR